jgi:hypothetical protein
LNMCVYVLRKQEKASNVISMPGKIPGIDTSSNCRRV